MHCIMYLDPQTYCCFYGWPDEIEFTVNPTDRPHMVGSAGITQPRLFSSHHLLSFFYLFSLSEGGRRQRCIAVAAAAAAATFPVRARGGGGWAERRGWCGAAGQRRRDGRLLGVSSARGAATHSLGFAPGSGGVLPEVAAFFSFFLFLIFYASFL